MFTSSNGMCLALHASFGIILGDFFHNSTSFSKLNCLSNKDFFIKKLSCKATQTKFIVSQARPHDKIASRLLFFLSRDDT